MIALEWGLWWEVTKCNLTIACPAVLVGAGAIALLLILKERRRGS